MTKDLFTCFLVVYTSNLEASEKYIRPLIGLGICVNIWMYMCVNVCTWYVCMEIFAFHAQPSLSHTILRLSLNDSMFYTIRCYLGKVLPVT